MTTHFSGRDSDMPFLRSVRTMHLLVPAVAAVVAALTLAGPGVSSASQASSPARNASTRPGHWPRICSSIENLYSTRHSVLRDCGYEFIARLGVKALPGGGEAYIYSIDGSKAEVLVPPPSFDPLTASAGRLSEYGIPTAKEVGSRSRWITIMRAARYSAPPEELIAGGPADPAGPEMKCSSSSIYCWPWAGYVATGETNFNYVEASYAEPYIGSSVCSNVAVGSWVGIGGYNTSILAQAGTSFGDTAQGQPNLHNEFQELVINSTGTYAPVWYGKVTYGDPIYANVSYTPTTPGWGKYSYYVSDGANGNTLDVTASASHYDGSSAEIITEAPGTYNLANFGTVTFTGAVIGSASTSEGTLSSWIPDPNTMTDNNGKTMAHPGPIDESGEDFTNYDSSCD